MDILPTECNMPPVERHMKMGYHLQQEITKIATTVGQEYWNWNFVEKKTGAKFG